jgi:hypothetical protein
MTTDEIKVAFGTVADAGAILAMVSIPVLNWLNKPKSGLFKMGNGRTVGDRVDFDKLPKLTMTDELRKIIDTYPTTEISVTKNVNYRKQ